jgi:hypothetical protein
VLKAQARSWQFDTLKRKEKLWSGFDEPKELGIEYWQLGVFDWLLQASEFWSHMLARVLLLLAGGAHDDQAQAANANKVEVQDQWSWGFTVVACCHALILKFCFALFQFVSHSSIHMFISYILTQYLNWT